MITRNHTSDAFFETWSALDRRYGNRPVLVWDEDGSTFDVADIRALAQAFAAFAAPLVGVGDVVAICGPGRPEGLIACWGTWLAGGIVAVIDPGRDREFVAKALARCKPRLALFASAALADAAPPEVKTCTFNDLPKLLAPGLEGAALALPPVSEDAPGAILFTSGSSGEPKGVVLSRRGLWGSARVLVETYGWSGDDRMLCTAGLHSMSGLRNPAVAGLLAGTTLILETSSAHIRPLTVAAACRRHGVSILTTAPAFLSALANVPREEMPRLRMILSTGAPLFGDVAQQAENRLAIPIYDYYGLTETSGACIMVTPDMHPCAPGVIGRPVDCIVRIVRDDGAECGLEEAGELVVSSDRLMLGYLDDRAATAAVLHDGWFHTGDIAIRHPDGGISLRGRRDDRIKTREGDVLYPADVEARLLRCPAVRDVHVRREPGDLAEPRLSIFVVPADPHADPDDLTAVLRRHLKCQGISGVAIGKVVLCEAIPRTRHGKTIRQAL